LVYEGITEVTIGPGRMRPGLRVCEVKIPTLSQKARQGWGTRTQSPSQLFTHFGVATGITRAIFFESGERICVSKANS